MKELKEKGAIDEATHRRIYPTTESPPRFYGLPKIHKPAIPLRPIVSSVGSIIYECAKFMTGILSSLVGRIPHHLKNSEEFAKLVQTQLLVT